MNIEFCIFYTELNSIVKQMVSTETMSQWNSDTQVHSTANI